MKKHYYAGKPSEENIPDNTATKEATILWKASFRKAVEEGAIVDFPTPETYKHIARNALIQLRNEYREAGASNSLDKSNALLEQLDRLFHTEEAGSN